MTEPVKPDDRELEQYLQGGSKLSRHYREASRETSPPDLDEAILARARAEVRRKPRPNGWIASLALAASVVLGLNLAWNVWEAQPVPELDEARPGAPATLEEKAMAAPTESARQHQKEAAAATKRQAVMARDRSAEFASEDRAAAGASAAAPAMALAEEEGIRHSLQELQARKQSEKSQALPAGWHLLGADTLYGAAVDEANAHSAPDSLVVWRTGPGVELCGRLQSEVPAAKYLRRTVRVTAFLKAQGVQDQKAMLFASFGRGGEVHWPLQSTRLAARDVWKQEEVEVAVPDNADRVVYGALLCGPGTLWIDDVTVSPAD